MTKRDWVKWLRAYYGVRLSPKQVAMVARFVECDGGRATWGRDYPSDEAVHIVTGSSKTFYAVLKPGQDEADFLAAGD